MGTFWRRVTIRSFLPFTFKFSRKRAARVLQQFSVTELDSAWQVLHAMENVKEPKLRKRFFQHAMEEFFHSDEFNRVSKEYSDFPPPRPTPERKPLYNPEKGMPSFIAYVYVGEKDVFDQFGSYSTAVGKNTVQNVFEEAQEDEKGHASLTMNYLVNTLGTKKLARKMIRRSRLKRMWEAWLRFSKRIGEFVSSILLSIFYFLLGPLSFINCKRRMAKGWEYENIRNKTEISSSIIIQKTMTGTTQKNHPSKKSSLTNF